MRSSVAAQSCASGAAGACLNVEKAVVGIRRVGEHAAEFHVRHRFFQLARVGVYGSQRGVVAFRPGDLEQLPGVAEAAVELLQRRDDAVEDLPLPALAPARASDRSRAPDPRAWRRFPARRRSLSSKSKIPPQFDAAGFDVGEALRRGVDTFRLPCAASGKAANYISNSPFFDGRAGNCHPRDGGNPFENMSTSDPRLREDDSAGFMRRVPNARC
jgi:hypothetical protein